MTTQVLIRLAVLEFTSLPMLGWLVAAVLPWLIHRWNRRQHRTTSWAAVDLLLAAMRKQSRSVRLQQWLLLAVRTAILLLVAFAAAEPTLREGVMGASANGSAHQILVLDRSYSMGGERQGTTRWQLAQTEARRWIESSDGNPLTVIGWANQAENLLGRPTVDTSIALSAVENLQLSDSHADLSAALQTVLAAIDRAETEFPRVAARQVVFFTDLGRETWSMDTNQRELWEAIAKRAEVKLVNVAEGSRENVAVTELTVDAPITLQQKPVLISATMTCFGITESKPLQVELLVDGRPIDQQEVLLQENGKASAEFSYRFTDQGPRIVQAVLKNHEDSLPIDDQHWLVVNVRPRLRVACVAGQVGAADDLARALAPGSERGEERGPIQAEVLAANRFSEVDLSEYAAIVLASPAYLSPREASTLTQYVRQGGGLALFPGEQTKLELFDRLEQLLPVRMGPLSPPGDYRFDPLEYRHSILSPFRGQTRSGLLGVSIAQYHSLQLRENRLAARAVMNFDSGDPALIVDRFGLGRVAVAALPGSLIARTNLGVPWSNFALSPSFLPVVRELVAYLIGASWSQQRNLLVGESAEFYWPATAKTVEVRMPDGSARTLLPPTESEHGLVSFQETNQCGVYRFLADGKIQAQFAVNLDGRDSDLQCIDSAALPAGLAKDFIDPSLKQTAVLRDVPLVRILLTSAVVLLLVEIGLAWLLGRRWG